MRGPKDITTDDSPARRRMQLRRWMTEENHQLNRHDAALRRPEVLLSRWEERWRDDEGSTVGRALAVTYVDCRMASIVRTADWCGLTYQANRRAAPTLAKLKPGAGPSG